MGNLQPDQFDKTISINLNSFPTHQEVEHEALNVFDRAFATKKEEEKYNYNLIRLRCADLIDGEQFRRLTQMLKSVDHENIVVAQAAIDELLMKLDY